MKQSLRVTQFNSGNIEEYSRYINKIPCEFYILPNQRFYYNKSIFLLIRIGIFNIEKVIGYAVMYEIANLDEETKRDFSIIHRISKDMFAKKDCIFIEDFMISKKLRRQGLGREFFNIIKNTCMENNNFLLKPDVDGKLFWSKIGFSCDKDQGKMIMKEG